MHGVLSLYLKKGVQSNEAQQTSLRSIADALAGAIIRNKVEASLRESEERFSLAVKGTNAGIWDWDIRKNRVYFSPRWKAMLGYDEGEISDKFAEWESRIHAEDRCRASRTLRCYLKGETADYELEHRLRHKDGTYRWVLARGAVVRDNVGKPYRMAGSHLDITKSKAAEERNISTSARLAAAQKIQEHLLPRFAPEIPGYDIAGAVYPAEFAAGDHFDYLPMQRGTLGLVIGDVSGHGFDSALLMASAHAYLRALARNAPVDEILSQANEFLVREFEPNRFVTMLFCCLDPVSGSFMYANAGHPAGYVIDRRGQVKAQLSSTSLPLGIMAGAEFQIGETVLLQPGDVVLLLTDGALEAESPDGSAFGAERAIDVIRNSRRQSADEIITSLHDAICQFSEGNAFDDDVTCVIIKVGRSE